MDGVQLPKGGAVCALYQPPARKQEHRGGRQPVALWGVPAEQGFAGDGGQRPLVPRSRFWARLTPSVRLLPSSKLAVSALLKQCILL